MFINISFFFNLRCFVFRAQSSRKKNQKKGDRTKPIILDKTKNIAIQIFYQDLRHDWGQKEF